MPSVFCDELSACFVGAELPVSDWFIRAGGQQNALGFDAEHAPDCLLVAFYCDAGF